MPGRAKDSMRTPNKRLLACLLLAAALPNYSPASEEAEAPDPAAECIERCELAEVECSRDARRGKMDCARRSSNRGKDPFSQRREYSSHFCGYFRGNHCRQEEDRDACDLRFRERYALCTRYYDRNMTSQYLDCGAAERHAVELCRDELSDCQAICKASS